VTLDRGAASDSAVSDTASDSTALDRGTVIEMLAAFGDRAPEAVDDVVGSLELTWLIAEVEQRYAVTLDLTDEQLAGIHTVEDAAAVLGDVLREALGHMSERSLEPESN
jgi:hypothetical protein